MNHPFGHQRSPMVCSARRSYAVGQLLRLTGCSNDRALRPSASKGAWWERDAAVVADPTDAGAADHVRYPWLDALARLD